MPRQCALRNVPEWLLGTAFCARFGQVIICVMITHCARFENFMSSGEFGLQIGKLTCWNIGYSSRFS